MNKGLVMAAVAALIAAAVYFYVQLHGRAPPEKDSPPVASGAPAPAKPAPAVASSKIRGSAEGSSATEQHSAATVDTPVKPDAQPGSQPPAEAAQNANATTPNVKLGEKALFDGWKDPALVLILSGEQHGYIEPCGCSLNQLGGLSRRADLFRQLHERGWTTTGFDVGGLVNNPNRLQGKLKFDMMVKCLTEMRYAGVANGVEELQLTFDFLSYHKPDELPFLGTNLTLFNDPEFTGAPLLKRVVTVGKVKLGVLAVFGPEMDEKLRPNGQGLGDFEVKILPPAESITKHLAALEAEKPDLLILLSHSTVGATKELAGQFPQFDIVVSAGGPEDPDPRPKFLGDKTLFVAPGQKGKHVPVVGFFPGDSKERLKYELVDLDDKRFQESPKIAEHMRFYQEDMLKERNLVANEPAIDDPRNFDPLTGKPVNAQENPFVGVKACAECHKSAYQVWIDTPHAKATETLKVGRDHKPEFISRIFDPECVACHVTGWDPKKVVRYKTGYEGEDKTPHLLGQQCENCHGPGGKHTELERLFAKGTGKKEEVEAWRKFHRLSVKTAYDLCIKCHDGDNDPNFKSESFEKYWDLVAHPGKD
ncbi:MAG: hypothetical protein HY290_19640 [Planctomycetia bacterium]|nr:hypothetical protein [Planctomycetia bacterium]